MKSHIQHVIRLLKQFTVGLILFFLSLGFANSDPKRLTPTVIHVPEDVLTIGEALSQSIAGDCISLASGAYSEPIVIKDASITIQGRSENQRPIIRYGWDMFLDYGASILVENSQLTIKHLNIIGQCHPALEADNTELIIKNCQLTGANELLSRYISIYATPALRWKNAKSRKCHIENTLLTGGCGIGGPAIEFLDCSDVLMQIEQSNVHGKDVVYPPHNGGCAIQIKDSSNVDINLNQSYLYGGRGYNSNVYSSPFAVPTMILGPDKGGYGVLVENSSLHIAGGEIIAGRAGDGGEHTINNTLNHIYENKTFDGGVSGTGIELKNHSYAMLTDVLLQGGEGGEPNGSMGLPYAVDDTSEIEFSNQTNVDYWSVY